MLTAAQKETLRGLPNEIMVFSSSVLRTDRKSNATTKLDIRLNRTLRGAIDVPGTRDGVTD
jgi:hypothetical protein